MIDTDKYEGHTEGPWVVNNPDDDESLIFSVGALKFVSSANTRLMADAPLLLEEVKRLREALKEANELEWQRREWVENYLRSKGMSCADVAQGLENFENYRSE